MDRLWENIAIFYLYRKYSDPGIVHNNIVFAVDNQIVREDSVAPEFATPEQKDEKAREKGYNSYADLEKQANMTVED